MDRLPRDIQLIVYRFVRNDMYKSVINQLKSICKPKFNGNDHVMYILAPTLQWGAIGWRRFVKGTYRHESNGSMRIFDMYSCNWSKKGGTLGYLPKNY